MYFYRFFDDKFMLRKFWIFVLFAILILPIQAQDTWEAVFYVEHSLAPFSAELRVYRSDGETTVLPLPANMSYGGNVSNSRFNQTPTIVVYPINNGRTRRCAL